MLLCTAIYAVVLPIIWW